MPIEDQSLQSTPQQLRNLDQLIKVRPTSRMITNEQSSLQSLSSSDKRQSAQEEDMFNNKRELLIDLKQSYLEGPSQDQSTEGSMMKPFKASNRLDILVEPALSGSDSEPLLGESLECVEEVDEEDEVMQENI